VKKTAVVTGATGGIGHVLAATLCREGYRLVLPCRSIDKAEALRSHLGVHLPGCLLDFIPCELSDLASVQVCASTILDRYPVIDLVIANAATVEPKLTLTPQSIERTFAVNHLAHFVLLSWLMARFYVHSRVIFVASSAAWRGNKDYCEDFNYQKTGYNYFQAYANTKLANVACARSFARLLAQKQIACTSVHPGLVAMPIWPQQNRLQKWLIPLLKKFYFVSPEKGAEPLISLALASEHNESRGHYNKFDKVKPPPQLTPSFEDRLWALSMELCDAYLPPAECPLEPRPE
jgi:NAD(P)-dependent dehydrogenase (short-subunit alcohol dehydrogenase family)